MTENDIKFSPLGTYLGARLCAQNSWRECVSSKKYVEMVENHYKLGAAHPDDVNYPINRWNDFE